MFSELRQQAAFEVKRHLGGPADYTPVGTLDTREVTAIIHEARSDTENMTQQITRATVFIDEVPDGKTGDRLFDRASGVLYELDSLVSRSETRVIWALKKVRAR